MPDHLPSMGPVGDLPDAWIEAASYAASRQHFEGVRAAQRAVGVADPMPYDELSERSRRIRENQVRGLAEAVLADVVPLIRAHIMAEGWQEGFAAGENMAHLWGHVDSWEDYPANPYVVAHGDQPGPDSHEWLGHDR